MKASSKSKVKSANAGMISIIAILFFTMCITGKVFSGNSTLKYVIHAFVKITTSEGKIIYIDPYSVVESDPADLILITHEDKDHNDLTRVTQKSSCQIVRSSNALINGVYQSFTIGNIKVKAVPAYDQWHQKEKCVGYVIEVDGVKVYHAGDTGRIPEMADLANQNITYAFLPMYIGGAEMNQAAEMINAKYVVPVHTNWPSMIYNSSLVAQFTSNKKFVVLPGETIELLPERMRQSGNVLRVPQDHSTIQGAINASQKGDTVLVSEGRFYENINFKGKGITVTSKFFKTINWQTVFNTIIDGSKAVNKDSASTVRFLNKEDSTSTLEGFTITGGNGTKWTFGTNTPQEGGGIILGYSSAVIRNNIITGNIVKNAAGNITGGGGGISSMYGNPTIINNVIVSNISGYAGGIVLNWSGGKIRNNIIYHNNGIGQYGSGGVMIWKTPGNTAVLENNTIVGNSSGSVAGGVTINLADGNSIPIVKNNIVWANCQLSGKQITNAQYTYNNDYEDVVDARNISIDPVFADASFVLNQNSKCIDAGDQSSVYNDKADMLNNNSACAPSKGNLRNDIGAYGGPKAKTLPKVDVVDLYTSALSKTISGKVGQDGLIQIDLLNVSSSKLTIDSIAVNRKSVFTFPQTIKGKSLEMFERDTISISFKPSIGGTLTDTVKIYYNAAGVNSTMKITLVGIITQIDDGSYLHHDYRLYNSYPNPFNPSTKIKFFLGKRSSAIIKIFDLLGREVEKVLEEELESGIHELTWSPGKTITSGVYFVRLLAGNFSAISKVNFIK